MNDTSQRPLALGSWRDVLGADVRTLAALRILLALSVLADLLVRSGDLVVFYTDGGMLPRAALLEQFAWLLELAPSVHLAGGSPWSQALLFGLQALAALCMLVGYRTRAATFVVWLLVSSLQLRNLYVGAGVDALLRMLLLWGVFLPLGARWSVDQIHRGHEGTERSQVVSFASAALLIQIAFVFGGAGLAKLDVPAWRDGTALAMILDDDVRTTAFGIWVGDQTWVCALLDRLVLAIELGGPALLFLPIAFGAIRTSVVALLVGMSAGFFVTLNVGLFPWVAAVAAIGLLPGWFWDSAATYGRLSGSPAAAAHAVLERLAAWLPPAPRPSSALGIAREGICALLLVFVIVFNMGVIRDPAYRPPGSIEWIGRSLFLQQTWRMFARPATRTGWISIEGRLGDERIVDLMAAGGPIPGLAEASAATASRPTLISQQYRNDRWRSFLSRAVRGTNTAPQLQLYGRYLCREWNAAHAGTERLMTFRVVWHARDIPGAAGSYTPETLWRHSCFK